jgi:hypothetical protein
MKTTIEILYEKFDKMPNDIFLTWLNVHRKGIIEKEKEQICQFASDYHDEFLNNGEVTPIEEYYNEYYNQNK